MRMFLLLIVMALAVPAAAGRAARREAAAGPMLTIETTKGTIEIQLFPPGRAQERGAHRRPRQTQFLPRAADPPRGDAVSSSSATRCRATCLATGLVGTIGQRQHRRRRRVQQALARARNRVVAYGGRPEDADSQIYILKAPTPAYDGKYVIIGQVVSGMDVVDQLGSA